MDKFIGFDIDHKHTVACVVQAGQPDRYKKFPRLYASSPTIEAGDTSAITVATDLDGNPRVHDADSADPGTGEVDMGAFEYVP